MTVAAAVFATIVALSFYFICLRGALRMAARFALFGPYTSPAVGYLRYACAALVLVVCVPSNVVVSWKLAWVVFEGFSR